MSMSSLSNYIGPNIEWKEDSPPFIYPCNPTEPDTHSPSCDGEDCVGRPMTELEVKLVNEMKSWRRSNRPIAGVPEVLQGQAKGFVVSLFDMETLLLAIKEILVKSELITEEDLNEAFQTIKLSKLTEAREFLDREELKPHSNHKPTIIGPDGKLLG